jgi:hypothetical protein
VLERWEPLLFIPNVDRSRSTSRDPHSGQETPGVLEETSSSNSHSQPAQRYS